MELLNLFIFKVHWSVLPYFHWITTMIIYIALSLHPCLIYDDHVEKNSQAHPESTEHLVDQKLDFVFWESFFLVLQYSSANRYLIGKDLNCIFPQNTFIGKWPMSIININLLVNGQWRYIIINYNVPNKWIAILKTISLSDINSIL